MIRWLLLVSLKLIIKRSKFFLSMLLAVACTVVLVYTVNASLESIRVAKYIKNANIYGEHHAILYNLTQKQIDSISEQSSIQYFGSVSIVEQGDIKNVQEPIYFGIMSDSFKQLGHIGILSGKYPQNKSEIAIEENLAARLGNLKPGSKLEIRVNGEQRSYTVSGIIYNYTGVWSIDTQDQSMHSALPKVLLASGSTGRYDITHVIIKFSGASQTNAYTEKIAELARILKVDKYTENLNMYLSQTSAEINLLQAITVIFTLGIALASFLVLGNALSIYTHSSMDRYHTLFRLGLSLSNCIKIIILQQTLIFVAGVLAGFVFGVISSLKITKMLNTEEYFDIFGSLLMSIATVFLVMLVCTIRAGIDLKNKILGKKQTNQTYPKHITYKVNPSITLCMHETKCHWKRFAYTIISLGICIAVAGIGIQFKNELQNNPSVNSTDYSIVVPCHLAYWRVKNYLVVKNSQYYLSWEDVRRIRDLVGVDTVMAEPFTKSTTLELKGNMLDAYWKYWISQNRPVMGREHNVDIEIPSRYSVSSIRFKVLDEKQFSLLNSQFFKAKLDYSQYTDNLVILFLPPVENAEGSSMAVGDSIVFGRIDNMGNVNSLDDAKYLEFEFQIGEIVNGMYILKDGNMVIQETAPTVVMTESAAKRSGIFPGYIIADIDANYKDIQNTEETLKNIVAQTPNSSYFSVGEYQARNLQLAQIVGILVLLLCFAIGGFGIVTTILTFYSRIITRKLEFGLFEVFGMRKIDIIKSLLLENFIYLLISMVLGVSFIFILNVQQGWSLSYLLNYVDEILAVSCIVLILGQLGSIIPIRTLLRQSIKDRIEYSE